MTATEVIALIVGLGGFLTAVITSRNAARQTDIAALQAEAEIRSRIRREHDVEVAEELNRLSTSLEARRLEIEKLYGENIELRRRIQIMLDGEAENLREIRGLKKYVVELVEQLKAAGIKPKTGPLGLESGAG